MSFRGLWISKWLPKNSFSEILDDYNDLLVIEHNLDVIRCADWVIYLGPDDGNKDGEIVVVGTPEEVAEHPTSHTGRYLKQVLIQHPALPVSA